MNLETHPKFPLRGVVASHYDSLAFLYRLFWGEHIHHGLWSTGGEPTRGAPERLISYLAQRASIRRGERILDVGCGYAGSGRWLARHLQCRVTGVTISRRQARLAHRRNRRAQLRGAIQIVAADARRLPFPKRTFDVLWVIECVEHLEDKRRFFRDAAELLRPGGRLAVCTWERVDAKGAAEEALVDDVCDRFLCPSLACASEYREWMREAGLEVIIEDDMTSRVRRTWDIVQRRMGWLPVGALARPLVSRETRRFVDGFPVIARAYTSGAMRYAVWVSIRRDQGRPGSLPL